MRPMLVRMLVAVAVALLPTTLEAQVGTIMTCSPSTPLISVAPTTPTSRQPITILVSADDSGITVVTRPSLVAVVSGSIIDVTLSGLMFSPAPPHLAVTCGSIELDLLPSGNYVINFFLDVHQPNPPTLFAFLNFTVDDPTPAPGLNAVMILVLLIGLAAAAVIWSRQTSRMRRATRN